MASLKPTNQEISDVLERVAALLEAQNANPYRVAAYRKAAHLLETWDRSIADLALSAEEHKLEDLPDIGKSIAGTIREFAHTGRLGLLERLEGQVSPEDLFSTVPGIGEALAHRIHHHLGIDTLEELELAAHDGRLQKIAGIGERRLRAIRNSVEAILSRSGRRRAKRLRRLEEGRTDEPAVSLILDVDREYRQKAEAGRLRTIAPRRFNPEGKAWLPILHSEREGWSFTALFSNTPRAHDLGKTKDWVVVYCEKDGRENQHTIVTESHGPLKGKRVVRGREKECLEFYLQKN